MFDCLGSRSQSEPHIRRLFSPVVCVVALTVMLVGLTTHSAYAQVMVFAPHPDDEALIASGVLYRAVQSGQTVKVVVVTNGDCEQPTIGHVREQETMAAMGRLGLAPGDVIFLGYPDCGLRDLYYYYTTPASQYTSAAARTHTYAYKGLGQTDYHSAIYGTPASYNGFSVLQDLQAILRNYKPQDIYVTSAYDAHLDHYALNFFLGEAIVATIRSDATFQPTLHEAIVHEPCPCDPNNHWPMPSFTPTQPFSAPPGLSLTPLAWSEVESVEVPAAMQATSPATNLKSLTIAEYTSQGGAGAWQQAFVKRDEIFWKWELWANLGLKATATASSAIGTGTTADRINDGAVAGFPVVASVNRGGKGEWVSSQTAGAWVQLAWPTAQQVTRMVLHDRPDATENVTGGTLTFSDGSSLSVGGLPTNGVGLPVSFPAKTLTWVRFTVNSATGTAAGLAELEVYGPPTSKLPWQPPASNTPPAITAGPMAAPLTVDEAATSAISVTGFDADGDLLTYSWTTTGGRIDGTGSDVTFVPPIVSQPRTYRITVFVADGRGGIASSWVDLSVTPSNSPHNAAGLATATASSEANNAHGQIAAKAIDGIVNGYPTDAQREWASVGELAGAWIQLTWATPVTISRSVLHDRINASDQILGGTLRFSDGSSVVVGPLPNDGTGLTTNFAPRTVTWIRFDVTNARGGAAGLAEWEVFTAAQTGSNRTPQIAAGPTATLATISDVQTSSLSVSATDADGDPLAYSWVASAGSISGSGATVTFTPPRITSPSSFRIDVEVTDGQGGSTAGFVNVSVTPSSTVMNLASFAAVSASTENSSRGQDAAKATDGFVDGYPTDATREWASVGQLAGAWIQLAWTTPQNVARVVLHDRINLSDQILSGTLRFSDGSSLAVGALPNDGAALTLDFATRSVTWIRLEVASARGDNAGLAELEVYPSSGGGNTPPQITAGPTATPATIMDVETANISLTASDTDGDTLSYLWQASGGSVVGSGSSATFTPPRIAMPATFRVLVTITDGHGGSASSFVDISVTPSTTEVNLAHSAGVTSSTENSSRGQDALKAIDGLVDGYPTNHMAEWAAVGELNGAWIQLTWSAAQSVDRVVLHDRINSEDQILGATLTFSDGTTMTLGPLPNQGAPLQIDFSSRSVTWIRLTVTSARGSNTGLAEFEVY